MYRHCIKRVFDVFISLIALPFVILIIAICAPLIYCSDPGPIFYNAKRRGYRGREFIMYKLRSMYVNSPDLRNADGSTFNSSDDTRVTSIGRFLRKTSLDEFPQFFNVLRGDMSIVGPRPTLTTPPYEQLDETQKKRLTVLPGLTGYTQAYDRNSISQAEKFVKDTYYVDHLSFFMDLRIVIMTVIGVLRCDNIYIAQNKPSDTKGKADS